MTTVAATGSVGGVATVNTEVFNFKAVRTYTIAAAAGLSVTLVPVLMMLFIRGKIMPEAKNPVNRFLIWVYRPIIAGVMRWKKTTIVAAILALVVSVYPASRLGSE